jgi:hypothetical protein
MRPNDGLINARRASDAHAGELCSLYSAIDVTLLVEIDQGCSKTTLASCEWSLHFYFWGGTSFDGIF